MHMNNTISSTVMSKLGPDIFMCLYSNCIDINRSLTSHILTGKALAKGHNYLPLQNGPGLQICAP